MSHAARLCIHLEFASCFVRESERVALGLELVVYLITSGRSKSRQTTPFYDCELLALELPTNGVTYF